METHFKEGFFFSIQTLLVLLLNHLFYHLIYIPVEMKVGCSSAASRTCPQSSLHLSSTKNVETRTDNFLGGEGQSTIITGRQVRTKNICQMVDGGLRESVSLKKFSIWHCKWITAIPSSYWTTGRSSRCRRCSNSPHSSDNINNIDNISSIIHYAKKHGPLYQILKDDIHVLRNYRGKIRAVCKCSLTNLDTLDLSTDPINLQLSLSYLQVMSQTRPV